MPDVDVTITLEKNHIYVQGNTYPLKDELRKLNYRWIGKYKKWELIVDNKRIARFELIKLKLMLNKKRKKYKIKFML